MKNILKVGALGSIFMGLVLLSSGAQAASALSKYKNQKHKPTSPEQGVVTMPCGQAYIQKCQSTCKSTDTLCKNRCVEEAPAYCQAREQKSNEAKTTLILQSLSLLAPVIAIAFDEPKQESGGEPVEGDDAYTFYWDRPSLHLFSGFGMLNEGTKAYVLDLTARTGYVGLTANYSYLVDKEGWLQEGDVGPAVFFGSKHIMAGFAPSLLTSSAPGVKKEYGFGLRAPAVITFDRFHLHYNPLLGKINDQWFFQFKIGGGYRITPSLVASLGYEYRKIVDLNDLTISESDLQGVFFYLSYRIN